MAQTGTILMEVIYKKKDNSTQGNPDFIEIKTSREGKGSITAGGDVEKGGSYQVVWKPAKGYEVQKVIVDGVERKILKMLEKLTLRM